MKKVIVIGGGAAGMIGALSASNSGAEVTLLEKNEKLGKKVFITGKGRCNVTNAGDTNEFFDFVNSNPKFLYSSIYGFDAFQVMDLVEANGCKLKTERGNRVFPESDHSSDVIRSFENALKRADVKIKKNTEVKKIIVDNDAVKGVVLGDGTKLMCDSIICATGGKSYASTGSDGSFFKIVKDLGIEVTPMNPGLVPLVSPDKICKDMMGLSLKNVGLDLTIDGKNIYSGFGEMLFTHFGISGPLVLTASSIYSKKYNGKTVLATIDLKPALDADKLDARILRDFDAGKNKSFKNILEGLVPKSMAQVIPGLLNISEAKKVNEITAEERKSLVNLLKNFTIKINGTRDFNEAIITIGGISVKEINPSTMESKKVKGLYFAGEMIDVDAYTGGYNLQIAWSTGYLAGQCAATNEE